MNRKKLLWLSDSPLLPTGYSTISHQITSRLAKDYGWEVVYLAHNFIGSDRLISGSLPYRLYGRGREDFCKDVIVPTLRKEEPAVFVTLLDTFMVYPWFLDLDTSPARTVFYYPTDGGGTGIPVGCDSVLRKMTCPISMSEYGRDLVKQKYGVDAGFIPHAVDAELYVPFDNAKKTALRRDWGLTGKYVVGVVARNQPRKMLDLTIKSFAVFCKDKPDAVLLLHLDPFDPAAPWDITHLVRLYGVENRVVYTGTTFFEGIPYEKMPEIYNLMDVFLLTTSGEGWGVPTTEAMSCEVPVIATDYTTTKEMVVDNGAGLGFRVAQEVTGSWLVERAIGDVTDCVDKLNTVYSQRALGVAMGRNGRAAVLAKYNWKKVAGEWNAVLSRLAAW